MQYTVRVQRDGVDPKHDEYSTESVVKEDLDKLGEEANDAYVAAVQEYDFRHLVSLFRDGVTLTEAVGTGTGALTDESDETDDDKSEENVYADERPAEEWPKPVDDPVK